ncbi:MAG: hypothetical protein V3V95_08195, partial [Thermodesulfobacteriota bacterium]
MLSSKTARYIYRSSLWKNLSIKRRNYKLKITILILTLNEIDGMKEIMPRIKEEWYDQLIVVDGGSTDGTIEWSR